ncbi:hypothetical protein DB347_12290 [Opitutaceae bacterium EW11]|nr:hypothetical protein DB347_12290 [Opitutaceae bacterium EW11]
MACAVLHRFRAPHFLFLALFSCCAAVSGNLFGQEAASWSVSTIAGSAGQTGTADANGAGARFNGLRGIAVDSAGQIFVADTFNHTIRKVNTSGDVTTFAGTPGTSGSADGTGTAAQFDSPAGLAIDAAGNLFVADMVNHTIRKITPTGVVTTLAGSAGNPGSDDGTGASARFQNPVGVAVDGSGNIYVADSGNSVIRKVTSAGTVSTLAGTAGETGPTDGSGSQARFYSPYGVAVDGSGIIYVADTFNHTIRQISSSGAVTTLAGSAGQSGFADATAGSARFSGPSAIAVDLSGKLYVTESANHTVRTISNGSVLTIAGAAGSDGSINGDGTTARFNGPQGVAVSASGSVFVSDTLNSTVRKLTRSSTPTPPPTPTPGGDENSSRLSNLSVRTRSGTGDQTLIAGFIISGTGSKQLLIRGTGPTLSNFGVSSYLADPKLELYTGSSPIASNDSWTASASRTAITSAGGDKLGAYAVDPKDAMLWSSLSSGLYTAQITGSGGGVALVEVFDEDAADAPTKLTNVSARTQVGSGENILIAGFIISGNSPMRVMIRACGPTLSNFGVNGLLQDPKLQLFQGTTPIAENNNWGTAQNLTEILAANGNKLGEYTLSPNDAVLLVTLQPGAYTAQVSGVNDTTGVALVEVNAL